MQIHAPIKDILVAKNVGVFSAGAQTTDWSIFYDSEPSAPPAPQRCLTITPYGGADSNPAWLLDKPKVQIRVRGQANDAVATWNKACEVLEALTGYPSHDWPPSPATKEARWVGVWNRGGVIRLGLDKNDRPIFVVNFQLIIEPVESVTTNRQPLPE